MLRINAFPTNQQNIIFGGLLNLKISSVNFTNLANWIFHFILPFRRCLDNYIKCNFWMYCLLKNLRLFFVKIKATRRDLGAI